MWAVPHNKNNIILYRSKILVDVNIVFSPLQVANIDDYLTFLYTGSLWNSQVSF